MTTVLMGIVIHFYIDLTIMILQNPQNWWKGQLSIKINFWLVILFFNLRPTFFVLLKIAANCIIHKVKIPILQKWAIPLVTWLIFLRHKIFNQDFVKEFYPKFMTIWKIVGRTNYSEFKTEIIVLGAMHKV